MNFSLENCTFDANGIVSDLPKTLARHWEFYSMLKVSNLNKHTQSILCITQIKAFKNYTISDILDTFYQAHPSPNNA